MLEIIISQVWPYLAALAGAIVVGLGLFTRGKRSGQQQAQNKRDEARLAAIRAAKENREDLEILDDDSLADEFDRLREQRRTRR